MNSKKMIDKNFAKTAIRKKMRAERRGLSVKDQKTASFNLAKNLDAFLKFKKWSKFGIYLARDGEISLNFWLKNLKHTKSVYLPIVHKYNNGKLSFAKYNETTKLMPNKFKILQPDLKLGLNFNWLKLDAMFLPLVAFDKNSNRLGMGGGFYDKTLARLNSPTFNRPHLIGIAHSLQEVEQLNVEKWDFRLDTIITDSSIFYRK